ncbi:chaperone modulator CbpM [Leptodesmis sp.]|uniref:chaperone modulator CbpM n=1 Tax=Leptodesmis sp. TaxID=3100501 RepID=UPI00405352FC
MSANFSLSQIVWSKEGERLYSFEQAAYLTQTSVSLLERFASLGLIEPVGSMLHRQDLIRVVKLQRLRRDLGLNLVGAAMVLDMAEKITQLKAQLCAYRIASK